MIGYILILLIFTLFYDIFLTQTLWSNSELYLFLSYYAANYYNYKYSKTCLGP